MNKNTPWWSLKTRMTLFTLCVFLISIWSLFVYASRTLYEDEARILGEQQLSTASIIAKAINTEFNFRFQALRQAAKSSADLMADHTALQASLGLKTELQYLFSGGIIITDRKGRAIADLPSSAGRIGKYYGNDAWVSGALQEGRSSVGRPIVGKVLGVPVFAMTVPVRNDQGKIVGSMSGVVEIGKLTFMDVIAGSRYGGSGGYMIIAPQYRLIVTGSDKGSVLKDLPAPGIDPSIDSLLGSRKEETSISGDLQGEKVLISTAVIPASGWNIVVSLPVDEAFAPLHGIQQRMLLATLFLTLVAGCLTWWMMRHQLLPLTRAVEILAGYTSPDLPIQALPVVRQDEVGELIKGFNRLLETLKKREASLYESHEILRCILATSKDGYLHVDRRGRLLAVNQTYVRQSGYTTEELIGMPIHDLEALENSRDIERHIQKIIKDGYDQFESRHRRKDGSIWDVEISTVYREVDGGQFFNFVRDITERKKAAEENSRLQEQFMQSQKIESVGRLAGGVAHDFNNMLGVILGHAEFALEDLDPTHPVHADLEEIFNAATRSSDLTRQLLTFARKQTITPKVLDLNDEVSNILKMLERMIGENIRLIWEPVDNLWPVKMDPSQLNQVLINLCVNARDAIPEVGTVRIKLENIELDTNYSIGHADVRPGKYVTLSVTDDGCGMDKDVLANIFEPFFTTKKMGRGTGLGLATVYGTVKQSGGFIGAHSKIGHGTTFEIYLPRYDGRPTHSLIRDDAEHVGGGNETVLLVEDETALLKMTGRGLESQGYTVLAANSPGEAISMADKHEGKIHLLLTDVVMPEMNGRALARHLLAIYPGMKCLFTSGYTDDVISSHGVLEEGVNFISKPYTMENLIGKMRYVLD